MINAQLIDRNKVLDKLSLLPEEPFNNKNKIVNKGLRKASRVILVGARVNLRQRNNKKTGNLYKSLSYKLKKRKLGSLVGAKKGENGGNHSHLVDRGTTRRAYTKNGGTHSTGSAIGKSYFSDAVTTNANRVANTLYETIDEAITRIILRGNE